MKNTFYVVQYNDCYGNGDDTKIEVLVKSKADFKIWLKELNKERRSMGEIVEKSEEFNLIPIQLFN